MLTKVLAAKRAARSRRNGDRLGKTSPIVLVKARGGGSHRHLLSAAQTACCRAQSKWLATHLQLRGRLGLDAGAARACAQEAKASCRSSKSVEGESSAAQWSLAPLAGGRRDARGLVNYNAQESGALPRASSEIEAYSAISTRRN